MNWVNPADEAMAYHIPNLTYDKPVKWLGEQDTATAHGITVPTQLVVDPIGTSAWIHEGNTWKHQDTTNRARAFDSSNVQSLLSNISSMDGTASFKTALPSADELLNSNERFQSRASAYLPTNRTEREQACFPKELVDTGHRSMWNTKQQHLLAWRGVEPSAKIVAAYGRMPLFDAMHQKQQFPDKSKGEIEEEILVAQQRVFNRAFDRSGPTDYGRLLPADDQRPHPNYTERKIRYLPSAADIVNISHSQ